MKGQLPLFSKGKDDWQTPPDLFATLHEEFHFTIDGAANAENHLLPRWFGPGAFITDALSVAWDDEVVFCNPPYSKCREFVAHAAAQHRCTSVLLIPARTDTRWFHEHIWDRGLHTTHPFVEVRFLKGRLKFIDPHGPLRHSPNSAPFPSMVVVFQCL